MRIQFLTMLLLPAALCFAPKAALAAESYDNCAGIITTLPTTITSQGVWCMQKDLATSITSGAAITINVNNVTIDCNDFKLGGLAAGAASQASGIKSDRQNVTIRHCNVRGFLTGIDLYGQGILVEDNRLDNNLYMGIKVNSSAANNLVRRNRVFDTGGATSPDNLAFGISAAGDILDNVVDGVFIDKGVSGTNSANGIQAFGIGTRISGNRVGGLVPAAGGTVTGIWASVYSFSTIAGNHVATGSTSVSGVGIYGKYTSANTAKTLSFCKDNIVVGFSYAIANCLNAGRNFPNY